MSSGPVKARLRRFVLRTSGSPLGAVYRGIYGLLTAVTTRVLARHPSVHAIYLSRGGAKHAITPGISDIDLQIVIDDDSDEKPAIERSFRALGRASGGIVDFYPNLVQTRSTFEYRWRHAPVWQARYLEGRSTWRLLHGEDVLAGLPPLTEPQRRAACYGELFRWWLLYAKQLVATRAHHGDAISRNALCYKAVGEVLDVAHALATGEHRHARERALEESRLPLAHRLLEVAAGRFLADEPGLVEETLAFLLRFFAELWASFPARPFLAVHPGVRQRIDHTAAPSAAERAYLDAVRRHLDGRGWRGQARLVSSALWPLGDRLLVVDAAGPPALAPLVDLAELHSGLQARMPDPIHPFVRVGDVGFPLAPALPRDFHRGLLHAAVTPDVFLQLDGPAAPVAWTETTRWFLCDWRDNGQWVDAPPAKQRQLDAIARSAAAGEVVYPLGDAL